MLTPLDTAMRVAVLRPRVSGYINACLKGLALRPQVEFLVGYAALGDEAPINDADSRWISESVPLAEDNRPTIPAESQRTTADQHGSVSRRPAMMRGDRLWLLAQRARRAIQTGRAAYRASVAGPAQFQIDVRV